jgi:hypothetical protein
VGTVLRFELFAAGTAKPETLWALVGDPRRLPEWTDAEAVEAAPEPPLAAGATFTTVTGGQRLEWTLFTVEQRLVEAAADTPLGRVAFGARVVRQTGGARLVLAGAVDPPPGLAARLRARLVTVPALRSRLDRWSHQALRVAGDSGS